MSLLINLLLTIIYILNDILLTCIIEDVLLYLNDPKISFMRIIELIIIIIWIINIIILIITVYTILVLILLIYSIIGILISLMHKINILLIDLDLININIEIIKYVVFARNEALIIIQQVIEIGYQVKNIIISILNPGKYVPPLELIDDFIKLIFDIFKHIITYITYFYYIIMDILKGIIKIVYEYLINILSK
uniref:Uncharacterized protein n=1 Tax=Gefionella okellyi TaxID=2853422 RepID=A0A0B5H810_9EUKA|nr:hypothetical protein [Gefionella okellyi]